MLNRILNNSTYVIYIIPSVVGFLTVFSFQPFNISILNFIILPILFLLLAYINKKTKSTYRRKPYYKNFFLVGYIFGFSFYLSNTYWISYSLTFDDSFKFLIPFAIIMIPAFMAIFTGLSTLIIGRFLNFNIGSIFLFSASLASFDFIRGKILTGFPWNLWAYSWSWSIEVLQLLNYLGLFAFNLIVITIFTLPAIIYCKINLKKKIVVFCFTILVFFSNYIFGSYLINQNNSNLENSDTQSSINIKVISPNFKLKYNISENEIENKLTKLIKLSDPINPDETFFIWPEGIFSGFYYREIYKFKDFFKKNFKDNHKIILGINTFDEINNKYYNSLIVVDNNFEVIHRYNKKKLVPFGEFLPLENIFQNFGLKKITEGYDSFSKGLNENILILGKEKLLLMICYEIIFPELIQNLKKETNLIINISEDGWFGNSIGPYQHFAKAVFRSIENGTFLVRAANQGVSAIISNRGETIKKLNPNEAGNIEMKIPLIKTGYKNKNDLIFIILLFTYLFIFIILKKDNAQK